MSIVPFARLGVKNTLTLPAKDFMIRGNEPCGALRPSGPGPEGREGRPEGEKTAVMLTLNDFKTARSVLSGVILDTHLVYSAAFPGPPATTSI